MSQMIKNYLNFINEKLAEYNMDAQKLKQEYREDEAILLKVRANICDIFYMMVGATDKKVAALKITDTTEVSDVFNKEYLRMFETIPQSWRQRLEQAKKHNDSITVKTEEVKLDTAQILRDKFLELTGGTKND